MSFFDNKRLLKIFVPVFWVSALILAAVSIFLTLGILINILPAEQTDNDRRTYHIVAAGTRSCSYSLSKILEGAVSVQDEFDCIVEEYKGIDEFSELNGSENLRMQLDYVRFVKADGLILYLCDENIPVPEIKGADGRKIPVVLIGSSNTDSSAISFIGANKYEVGKLAAKEILSYGRRKNLLVIAEHTEKLMEDGTIISSMSQSFKQYGSNIEISFLDVNPVIAENILGVDEQISRSIARLNPDSIFCLSADYTVLAAQAVLSQNKTGMTEIIGLYDNEEAKDYLKRGIVSSLITVDFYGIGKKAVAEIFNWKEDGFANSYVNIDIEVIR